MDGRQYLVTARHVAQAFDPSNRLYVFGNSTWTDRSFRLVGHGTGATDVSVLAPESPLSPPGLPIVPSSAGLIYGQEVYFLGFPYDVLGSVVFAGEGFHLPLVKRATMSCFAGDVYLLDGHNNPGFSGGPVLFGPPGQPPTNIGGVISGYRFEPEPVYKANAATELSVRYNTGIIVSYKIETALSLVKRNPIGAAL